MSLEELRRKAIDDAEDPFGSAAAQEEYGEDLLFGLNAVERMFLSIGLFLVVTVFSFLLLLMSDSIALP
jgi:hypothetical protein